MYGIIIVYVNVQKLKGNLNVKTFVLAPRKNVTHTRPWPGHLGIWGGQGAASQEGPVQPLANPPPQAHAPWINAHARH